MKILAVLMLKVLYWMAVAYLPIAIIGLGEDLRTALGCAPTVDCRSAQGLSLADLQFWGTYAAVLLWPLCLACTWRTGLRAAKALHAATRH